MSEWINWKRYLFVFNEYLILLTFFVFVFCLFACCSYDEELEEVVDNADEDIKKQCTVDGEVDIGCVIDGVTLGTEAADLYLEVVENANTVSTSGPTSAPTGKLSESSGSQGDPHCK
jgi:hypothetical protein